MKRFLASVAVVVAVVFVVPTSATAGVPAKSKFDCKKAAAAWKKQHPGATVTAKQAEALALAQRGSCNIKTKDL